MGRFLKIGDKRYIAVEHIEQVHIDEMGGDVVVRIHFVSGEKIDLSRDEVRQFRRYLDENSF